MKELITEVASASISTAKPTTTDDVVSQYESKIVQSISAKNLLAIRDGQAPIFTKEEIAYLRKSAEEADPMAEVKVITPDPTITLKKGKTEINIRNAATLVKKMEEIYPSPNRPVDAPTVPTPNEDDGLTGEDLEEIIQELEDEADEPVRTMTPRAEATMAKRFQKIVNHPTTQVSPEVARCVAPDEKTFQQLQAQPAPEPIKTVNKNAYEIRTDVLGMALDWVKFKRQSESSTMFKVTDDEVLTTAQKFYKFVENRR